MARLKSTVYKLQKALSLKGRYVRINQKQFWSDKMEKFCTKYELRETVIEDGVKKDVVFLETFNTVDVVKCLAELLNGG